MWAFCACVLVKKNKNRMQLDGYPEILYAERKDKKGDTFFVDIDKKAIKKFNKR